MDANLKYQKLSKTRYLFITSHGQAGLQLSPGMRYSIMCNRYLERQTLTLNVPPSSIFHPAFIAENSAIWHGISWDQFDQLGSALQVDLPLILPLCFSKLKYAFSWSFQTREV